MKKYAPNEEANLTEMREWSVRRLLSPNMWRAALPIIHSLNGVSETLGVARRKRTTTKNDNMSWYIRPTKVTAVARAVMMHGISFKGEQKRHDGLYRFVEGDKIMDCDPQLLLQRKWVSTQPALVNNDWYLIPLTHTA
jgi:hypothetical protein